MAASKSSMGKGPSGKLNPKGRIVGIGSGSGMNGKSKVGTSNKVGKFRGSKGDKPFAT